MFYLLISFHIILCLFLIGLVLLQQGKGADMGVVFGGGANTVFGAGGAAPFLTKLTTWTAIAFMCTSILLSKYYSSLATSEIGPRDVMEGSVMEGSAPAPAENPPAEQPENRIEPKEPVAQE